MQFHLKENLLQCTRTSQALYKSTSVALFFNARMTPKPEDFSMVATVSTVLYAALRLE
jgi:hypothetical protein